MQQARAARARPLPTRPVISRIVVMRVRCAPQEKSVSGPPTCTIVQPESTARMAWVPAQHAALGSILQRGGPKQVVRVTPSPCARQATNSLRGRPPVMVRALSVCSATRTRRERTRIRVWQSWSKRALRGRASRPQRSKVTACALTVLPGRRGNPGRTETRVLW